MSIQKTMMFDILYREYINPSSRREIHSCLRARIRASALLALAGCGRLCISSHRIEKPWAFRTDLSHLFRPLSLPKPTSDPSRTLAQPYMLLERSPRPCTISKGKLRLQASDIASILRNGHFGSVWLYMYLTASQEGQPCSTNSKNASTTRF